MCFASGVVVRCSVRRPLLRLDDNKAGFAGADRSRVERVMNDASQGSAYYAHEQQLAVMRESRVEAVKRKVREFEGLSLKRRNALQRDAEGIVRELTGTRSLGVFVHLDMDMFYAAVEEKKNPSLKNVPFAVGNHNMLATTNYIARKFGVRAGIPGYVGRRVCPELVFVPTDMDSYKRESEVVHRVAQEFDPNFSYTGLDELTMDLRPFLMTQNPTPRPLNQLLDEATRATEEIRQRVLEATQLTCSGGVAATPALSKIVGNYNKPNGQYTLSASSPEEIIKFVGALPLRRFPGIGAITEAIAVGAFGWQLCGDLLLEPDRLLYCLPKKTARFLLGVGLGTAGGQLRKEPSVPKSISFSRTLPEIIRDPVALKSVADRFLQLCCESLQRKNLVARVVALTIRKASFETEVTSKTLQPTRDIGALRIALNELLEPVLVECHTVRLLGVRLTVGQVVS